MKKTIMMSILASVLMSACSGIGLNIGTSIIPGVYIGTSGTLDKEDIQKMKHKDKKEEVKKVKEEKVK